jgi:hypothetical protein
MKIHLLIVISLISFVLATGCIEPQSSSSSPDTAVTTGQATPLPTSGSPVAAMTTAQATATQASLFPGSPNFTTLITVSGQSGKTSDTFFVPAGYWELWYTADPLTLGGQDSVSASGSNSALFPVLRIQVIDTTSDRVIETVEPPGGLDKNLWVKSGRDPRPWKQKIYVGNKEFHLVITTEHLKSYSIEVRIPKSG